MQNDNRAKRHNRPTKYKVKKRPREIPDQIGKATTAALEKIDDEKKKDDLWVKKLKAIELCYREHMTDGEIAASVDSRDSIEAQTVALWFRDIVGDKCSNENEQAIARSVKIIEGMSSASFNFADAYWESTRNAYVDGIRSHPTKGESTEDRQVKQGRKEFRSMMRRAGINLVCFTGKDGELHFNEDGKQLVIDVLDYRTRRKEEDQDTTILKVYQDIRKGDFPSTNWQYYEWMLQKACSNLRDLRKVYPEYIVHTEADVREEFWRNSCRRNKGFNAFPGMSYLGKLPWQISEGWFFVFEDVLYIDQLILAEFSESKNWDDEEMSDRKERWITYLLCVLAIRCHEHKVLMDELALYSLKERDKFNWLLDYLFAYENEHEDEYEAQGVSLTKEEKWASREIAEDKRLRANIEAMRKNIANKNLNEESEPSKAAQLFCDWASKARSMPRRLSVETVVECANMLLDPTQRLEESGC